MLILKKINSQPPCKTCDTRSVGCHGRCEKYLSWKTERDKELEIERNERKKRYFV